MALYTPNPRIHSIYVPEEEIAVIADEDGNIELSTAGYNAAISHGIALTLVEVEDDADVAEAPKTRGRKKSV